MLSVFLCDLDGGGGDAYGFVGSACRGVDGSEGAEAQGVGVVGLLAGAFGEGEGGRDVLRSCAGVGGEDPCDFVYELVGVGLELLGAMEMGDGVVELVGGGERFSELERRPGLVGQQLHGFLRVGEGGGQSALSAHEFREVVMGQAVGVVKGEQCLEVVDGVVGLSFVGEECGEIELHIGVVGVGFEGLFDFLDGLADPFGPIEYAFEFDVEGLAGAAIVFDQIGRGDKESVDEDFSGFIESAAPHEGIEHHLAVSQAIGHDAENELELLDGFIEGFVCGLCVTFFEEVFGAAAVGVAEVDVREAGVVNDPDVVGEEGDVGFPDSDLGPGERGAGEDDEGGDRGGC